MKNEPSADSAPATPPPLSGYDADVLASARKNHILLFQTFGGPPTDEMLRSIGAEVLQMWDQGRVIFPYQDDESEAMRMMGQMEPELIVRFTKC